MARRTHSAPRIGSRILGLTLAAVVGTTTMSAAALTAPAAALAGPVIAELGTPEWTHETVSSGSATVWVEQDVSVEAGATLKLRGTGWTNSAGTAASTVAIKLNSGPLTQYARSGSDVITHPSAGGDGTIWALLAPENPTGHSGVHEIGADGSFEIAIDLPAGLTPGGLFTVRFQSGLFAEGDVARTLTTAPLVVGGVPYVDEDTGELPTCIPSTPEATVTVEPSVTPGSTIHVSGTGWCHPGEHRGGSHFAIKLDEGTYSHLPENQVHSNRTIWALVQADDATGDWAIDMQLPDGTDATSTPAFPNGAHSLRLLSGSLKDGDAARSVKSEVFVVGEYAPGVFPNPLDIAGGDLTNANRHGVTVQYDQDPELGTLRVTAPEANPGDWVFVNAYAGNSTRTPFPAWHRLDDARSVHLPFTGTPLVAGDYAITVQSGNRGEVGTLLGWASLTVPGADAETPAPVTPPQKTTPAKPGATAPTQRPVSIIAPLMTQPTEIPRIPVQRGSQLTRANAHMVTSVVQDGTATLTVPSRDAGAWVYAYIYTGADVQGVGWLQLDDSRQVRIDVSELANGNHKVALLDAQGTLVGWGSAATGTVERAELRSPLADSPVPEPTSTAPVPAEPAPGNNGLVDSLGVNTLLIAGAGVVLIAAIGSALVIRKKRGVA